MKKTLKVFLTALLIIFVFSLQVKGKSSLVQAFDIPSWRDVLGLPQPPHKPEVPTKPTVPTKPEVPTKPPLGPTSTPVPTPTPITVPTVGEEEVVPTATPTQTPAPIEEVTPTPTSLPGPTATPKPEEAEAVGGPAEEEGKVVGAEAPTPAPGEVMGLAAASSEGYTEKALMILGALCAGVGLKLLRTSRKVYEI